MKELAQQQVVMVGFVSPRLSSSIIDTLNLYVNGTLIENIQDYGHLYSTLYDISATGDQTAKRYLENSDPSIYVESTPKDAFMMKLVAR